ncbi:putative mitochondrial protein AtMg00820 [Apium graveolens]|uniref:putative mitochondrial protein AtMg00820 n=1 Tax=Apium graveolens TaxID=4045 RepID=UPI003D7A4362
MKLWDRSKVIIDDVFVYSAALDVDINCDPEPQSVDECRRRKDWPKWKDAIQTELNSLRKREVFRPVVQTPIGVNPNGNKWVFIRKRNKKNKIMRYKARLVAHGFSQRPGIDYQETYSPVMDGITFRFILGMASKENLETRLMASLLHTYMVHLIVKSL